MMLNIFNYNVSFLNPLLKLVVPFMFLYGAYYFYRVSKEYSNEFRRLMNLLSLTGVVGFCATLFRFIGDFVSLWKWGESLGFYIFAMVCLSASGYAAGRLTLHVSKILREK